MKDITCGSVNINDVEINSRELAQRLKVPAGFTHDTVEKCIESVKASCVPKYCCIQTPVSFEGDDTAVFDFASFKSKDLCKNLKDCTHAYIMAVTLGIDTDRLINRLSITSKAESFIADAVASALAEAVIDHVNNSLKIHGLLHPRFSPGYGDFELSAQRPILQALNADKLIGIKLGDNLIMTPRKSITAVCGIEKEGKSHE